MADRKRAAKRKTGEAAHDTPTLGPRRRPRKVRPAPATAPRGHRYDPGARPPARDPWIDEGDPEVNG